MSVGLDGWTRVGEAKQAFLQHFDLVFLLFQHGDEPVADKFVHRIVKLHHRYKFGRRGGTITRFDR